jgi:uncharacterized protein YodC (DUF2158 family)
MIDEKTSECPFKKGDVVQLKSSSSPMTVEAINSQESLVYCCWMNEDREIIRAKFDPVALKKW